METLLSWFNLVISNFTCLNANIRAHVCSLHCILSVVSICFYSRLLHMFLYFKTYNSKHSIFQ